MTPRRKNIEPFRAFIDHINNSKVNDYSKSDFRHSPTNIKPDSAEELFEIVKLVQDQMSPIEAVIEIKGNKYLKLK